MNKKGKKYIAHKIKHILEIIITKHSRPEDTEEDKSPFTVHRQSNSTTSINDIRCMYSMTRQVIESSPSDYRFEQNHVTGEVHDEGTSSLEHGFEQTIMNNEANEVSSTFGSLNNSMMEKQVTSTPTSMLAENEIFSISTIPCNSRPAKKKSDFNQEESIIEI
uniref:Uncharacterized protein n=1 Tax=Cacopsylla melanoneura TaxID=428564 RepID=A0A8D8QN27_9HEMI